MTLEQIAARLDDIQLWSGDSEVAHGLEDSLHQDVLAHIATLGGPASELAALALQSNDISFARWRA